MKSKVNLSLVKNDSVNAEIEYKLGRVLQEAGDLVTALAAVQNMGLAHCRDGRHSNFNRLMEEYTDVMAVMDELLLTIFAGDREAVDAYEIEIDLPRRHVRKVASIRMECLFRQKSLPTIPKALYNDSLEYFSSMEMWFDLHSYIENALEDDLYKQVNADVPNNVYNTTIQDFFLEMYHSGRRDIFHRDQEPDFFTTDELEAVRVMVKNLGRFCSEETNATTTIQLGGGHVGAMNRTVEYGSSWPVIEDEVIFLIEGICLCIAETGVFDYFYNDGDDSVVKELAEVGLQFEADAGVGDDTHWPIKCKTKYGWWALPIVRI